MTETFVRTIIAALLGVFCDAATGSLQAMETISLAGEWKLGLDPKDEGVGKQWFNAPLADPVKLPGSLGDSGYGGKDAATGTHRISRSWTPLYSYEGPAWYQKEIVIPGQWKGKRVKLFLERAHWWTQVWVDDKPAGPAQGDLSVPQVYDLTALLTPGQHRLSIRVDVRRSLNRVNSSHQFQLQGRWNGIIGRIELQATDPVWIESVQVYPDIAKRSARVRLTVGNATGKAESGQIELAATLSEPKQLAATRKVAFTAEGAQTVVETEIGPEMRLWDEFTPNLYDLKTTLTAGANHDQMTVSFGMREFKTRGRQFTINERPVFLRGRTDDAIFPLTAYPPMEKAEWKRLFKICKEWGLNHSRYHSWCPPEAAFQAADEVGFYLQPEPSLGGSPDPDDAVFVTEEVRRILDRYGNHPSFVMFSGGNEWLGREEWVKEWQQRDSRHLYTHASNGGGFKAASDFWVNVAVARSNWGRVGEHPGCLRGAYHDPLVGHINNTPPSTLTDYLPSLDGVGIPNPPKIDKPVVSHETGQYNAYPNFREMAKYTGAFRVRNFELFRESLEAHHMLDQADDFVRASGELQVILYREEIEAALRTPGFGGFQLLDIQDYPGQGTALCGILDPFMESKGYGNPEEFRHWCAPVVPLLRMKQYTWTTDDTFTAEAQVAHYGPEPFDAAVMKWSVENGEGRAVASGVLPAKRIAPGEVASIGRIELPLSKLAAPAQYTVSLVIENTPWRNQWKIWLYPQTLSAVGSDVLVIEQWGAPAEQALASGRKVLYLPKPSAMPHSVAGSFATDFWCYPMFKGFNPPGTLGILCDPKHPALASFPTEFHSNWQWWDLLKHSRSMILDELPDGFRPVVQIIDNLERNQKLGALFEAKVGPGRLMVCSIDLVSELDGRPAARQFRYSLLSYMESDRFNPATSLPASAIASLGKSTSQASGLELAEPVGTHRAALEVHCGAKLQGRSEPWRQELDEVAVKLPGFDYRLGDGCQSMHNFGVSFWQAPKLSLTLTCPKGWTGNLHLRLQDLGFRNRSGTLILNGRKLGELKAHEDGAWVVIPLTAQDTANGRVAVSAEAPPDADRPKPGQEKNLIATDLVLMPTGESDPG